MIQVGDRLYGQSSASSAVAELDSSLRRKMDPIIQSLPTHHLLLVNRQRGDRRLTGFKLLGEETAHGFGANPVHLWGQAYFSFTTHW